jgi:hypothetical protein
VLRPFLVGLGLGYDLHLALRAQNLESMVTIVRDLFEADELPGVRSGTTADAGYDPALLALRRRRSSRNSSGTSDMSGVGTIGSEDPVDVG